MKDSKERSSSCSPKTEENLTIFDAPNVCRELMAQCDDLAKHPDPAVAKAALEMAANAKQMLDAIVASADQLLAAAV